MQADKKKSKPLPKNLEPVLKSALADPTKTIREREQETWVSKSTVARALEYLGQNGTKDGRLSRLAEKDIEIQELIQEELKRRVQEEKEKMRNTEMVQIAEFSFKRAQLLGGGVTGRIDVIGDLLKEIQDQ